MKGPSKYTLYRILPRDTLRKAWSGMIKVFHAKLQVDDIEKEGTQGVD